VPFCNLFMERLSYVIMSVVMYCGIISLCQLAATSTIVKCF